jgi:hypothetical protein
MPKCTITHPLFSLTQAVKVARIVDMAQEAQINVSFELPL